MMIYADDVGGKRYFDPNDTEENIKAILDECIRVGVKGIICFGMGLTLRDGDREYYYAALDRYFPGMKHRYMERYGNSYELPSPKAKELMSLFMNTCKEHGILCTPDECFGYLDEFPEKYKQMSILDFGLNSNVMTGEKVPE